ncbi:MAG TPA: TIGR03435 family protein [Bryobacteraceae bacterium]|nr:TIGR03435 family protein [Bryobacteraceae bacterium]
MRHLILLIAAAPLVCAQQSFEAVSIKPHPEPINISRSSSSGTYAFWEAETLRDLITEAWDLRYYQVPDQPSWIVSEHFDISARAPGSDAPSKETFRQMLQAMLADRFRLRVHFETKEIPVYRLVVSKSGHKLKEPDMNSRIGYTMGGLGKIEIVASHGTMSRLADQLSNSAGRPVFDKTGLDGMFAFKLEFNPSTTAESDLPSLPAALQDQLGLRLESQKAPVEVLVVDSAEPPGEN